MFFKTKNVPRGEAILRMVIGAMCVVLAFSIPGTLRWLLCLSGIALLLTVFFGY